MLSLVFLFAVTVCSIACHKSRVSPESTKLNAPSGFDVSSAMSTLFGNYDAGKQLSYYDVPKSAVIDLHGSSFERGDDIEVRPFWIASTKEGDTRRVILLTYAVPSTKDYAPAFEGDEPFSCHACAPLIGAAVLVESEPGWKVESSRTAVTQSGGWGRPPDSVRIVHVGPRRIGIEITDTDTGQGQTTSSKTLLVPWEGKINEALVRVVRDDDKGMCGKDSLPCYSNRKKPVFVSGTNPDYYDVVLTLSGTDITESDPIIRKHVHGTERLQFRNGTYETESKQGDTTSVERFVAGASEVQK